MKRYIRKSQKSKKSRNSTGHISVPFSTYIEKQSVVIKVSDLGLTGSLLQRPAKVSHITCEVGLSSTSAGTPNRSACIQVGLYSSPALLANVSRMHTFSTGTVRSLSVRNPASSDYYEFSPDQALLVFRQPFDTGAAFVVSGTIVIRYQQSRWGIAISEHLPSTSTLDDLKDEVLLDSVRPHQ